MTLRTEQETKGRWQRMLDWNFIGKAIVSTSAGIPETLELVVVSLLISIPPAYFIAVVNLKPDRILSKVFQVYISFVRSIPVVVVIFLLYHSLPLIVASILKAAGSNFNIYSVDNMVYGYIVFAFVSIPSLSEIFRAGLNSIPKLQREAADSIGMTAIQAYIHIIIPQTIDCSLPILCNFVNNLIKMTSLAFCMSIREITGEARVAAADSIRYVECYLVIFVMYLVICMIVEQIFKRIEKRRKVYYGTV